MNTIAKLKFPSTSIKKFMFDVAILEAIDKSLLTIITINIYGALSIGK